LTIKCLHNLTSTLSSNRRRGSLWRTGRDDVGCWQMEGH